MTFRSREAKAKREPERRRFKWPCHKRRAHGPHLKGCMDHPLGWGGDGSEFRQCKNCKECPGVKAHPSTMIGGAYDEW